MIETFTDYQTAEGWTLALGDPVVFTDYDDEVHHIEVADLQDQNTDFIGTGYCHDHDDTCSFTFGAFEEVTLWIFTQ